MNGTRASYSETSKARSNMSSLPSRASAGRSSPGAPGGSQSSTRGACGAGPVEAAPDPRDQIAPVVEVEVRDRDRLDARPGLALAQLREHAGPAVEQQLVVDEVARAGPAGVGPGGRGADDREAHRRILPTRWPGRSEW